MKIYTLTCDGCQRQYTTKWRPKNNVHYCSKSCANKHRPRRKMEGQCHCCQKQISSTRKYCKQCLQDLRDKCKLTLKTRIRESSKKAVKSYVRRIKELAVKYKGGKCQLCGYCKCNGSLHFHHVNEDAKSFTVSGKSISFARIKPELDKCILVCANCHGEIHNNLIDLLKLEKMVAPQGIEPCSPL